MFNCFYQGNSSEAYTEYLHCLQIFGISLPASKFESFTSTTWQFVRLFFHRLWIGRWLSRKSGGLFCSGAKRSEALTSARELSLVFNRLNQLHLATNMNDHHGLMMSLYAVNMAEASINVMNPSDLINIYMTASLRVKQSYPRCLKFFARYYLSNAKAESAKMCGQIKKFQWAFTPYGYRFFILHDFATNSDDSIFATLNNKADPMTYVMKEYREHLLNKAIQYLVGAVGTYGNKNMKNAQNQPSTPNVQTGTIISNVLNYTTLLRNTMSGDEDLTNKDEVVAWWCNVLMVAAYWLLGEDNNAKELYALIDHLPEQLKLNNEKDGGETLPKALHTIFKAKEILM